MVVQCMEAMAEQERIKRELEARNKKARTKMLCKELGILEVVKDDR